MFESLRAIAVVLLVAAAGTPAAAAQRVRVAVFNNPPLIWFNAAENHAGGIFMDVLNDTARKEGWVLEYVPMTPDQSFEQLASGQVDLRPATPHVRAQEPELEYTREPLATSWGRLYVRPGSKIQTVRDLSGKTVAVLKGSLLQKELLARTAASGRPATLLECPDFSEAFRAVADGKADAVLANRFTGALQARRTGLRPTKAVLAPYGFRFAAKKGAGRDHLLDALDRNLLLLKTDTDSFYYHDLQQLEEEAGEFAVPAWAYWAGGAALVIAVLALGWALTAQRAAPRITGSERELRKANSALHRAHEEVYRITQNSLDLIAVLDANFNVHRVNGACTRLLGYRPEDVIGKSPFSFLPPERQAQARAVLERVRAGEAMEAYASQAIRADGTAIPMLWSLVWSEAVQELYAIGHDDTERHALIGRLKAHSAQLEAANEGLLSFARSVSHDLRAPVAAVEGFVGKVLRDDGERLQERSRSLLTRAHRASRRMDDIIANLLRLARLTEAGVHRRRCNVTAMCADIIACQRNADTDRNVTVIVQPDMMADADRELLRHVFENLISNAWKFSAHSPDASIIVGCDGEAEDPVFFVSDNGIGFDTRLADGLFTPFARLHPRDEYEGTGIGLSIVHRVIKVHGGSIWFDSAPGRGSVFRFTLGQRLEPDAASFRRSAPAAIDTIA